MWHTSPPRQLKVSFLSQRGKKRKREKKKNNFLIFFPAVNFPSPSTPLLTREIEELLETQRHCWRMQSSQGRPTSGRTFRVQLDIPRALVVLLLLASVAEVRSYMPCSGHSGCYYNGCAVNGDACCWGCLGYEGFSFCIDTTLQGRACPEPPCPAGTFNSVGGNCGSGGLGRGGGTECSCTTCPPGEMIDIAIPFFSMWSRQYIAAVY